MIELEDFSKSAPYSWELEFYKKHNIPLWETKELWQPHDLGTIYSQEDGSYIKAAVECAPAQFWKFDIYCAEDNRHIKISTGSGCLSKYFDIMVQIADGMVVVDEISQP